MCSIMKAPQQVLQQGLCFSCKEFKHVSTFNLQPSHFPLAETETQLAWNPKSDCCCILWTPRWASAWTNTFLLIFLLLLHLNLHHPPLLLLYALLQTPARAPLKVLMKAAGQRRGADTEPERRREEDSLHFKNQVSFSASVEWKALADMFFCADIQGSDTATFAKASQPAKRYSTIRINLNHKNTFCFPPKCT